MTLSPPLFRKRYKSSYKTSSSSSSPTLPLWKRYQGTSELIADTETDSDESEEESIDSESEEATSEDQQQVVLTEDTAEDEPSGLGYRAARRRALELAEAQCQLMSLEQGKEHATITFGALWRPVLALEAWAGHSDAQRAALWQARYEDQREIHDLRMQRAADQRELQELRERVAVLERRFGH
ncbi:hypothetical protein Tco_0843586 [Tanacetum coccineum]|uniref:Uncharacterized protein n=1 Tax=Tanacetum coccineum TaxID=301880 RepID=A0ABQ5B4D4_9ASTR